MKTLTLVISAIVAANSVPSSAASGWSATPSQNPPSDSAVSQVAAKSYIVQAPTFALAMTATRRSGAKVTHELRIINAVAAQLTPAQVARLRANSKLTLTLDSKATVAGGQPPSGVQPYVVEHTHANLLHSSGITGLGVTIAFLDTGWWSQQAVQTNSANHQAVLQGYDAVGEYGGHGGAG